MRNISAWAIRHPVTPIVLFVVLFFLGVVAFVRLPINLDPDVSFPVVNVNVTQPGAAPTELETQIAQKVEGSIANIGHRAIDGRADLELHVDIDHALDDERGHIAHIADARYRAFHLLRDLRLHLRWRRAGLRDVDVDQGKGHIGNEIDGQADEGDHTQEEQHDEQHDGRHRVTNRPCGNISHERPDSFSTGFTNSPGCRKAPAVATTCSLPLMPSAMVTPFSTIPETRTARRSILFCALTMKT